MAEYIEYEHPKIKVKFLKLGKYSFSSIEIKHLIIAMIMIILTLFVHQYQGILSLDLIFSLNFLKFLGIYTLSVGTGFLFHELGHKLVAQHYGFISEFRADFQMLFLMFIAALFLPILLLAPGAVMILGRPSRRQNGIISVTGPLVNLSLAIIFILISTIFHPTGTFEIITNIGISVNAFLGIFNMLPIWVLDGKKVLAWNKPIYFTVMLALILVFII